ncbi:MAG TPA: LysR family transcriptional regulator [Candidatus Onthocola gallistercoris]|uniref:LysR family transcriptional regulator n=1 Tax=Candidatus Onthocola gallistercoris TaxID=2840876 RepID=A0A9D1HHK1_9FIRM|nr:LysR family transcriptional regulator [Candidatus Onthocola gallistercoris]
MDQHLSLYRIFYVVANTGNISQAAKQLYISQPAISKSISRLEESLDVKLFTRSSRGVFLTAEGKILFQHIQKAFEAIDTGENKIKRMTHLGVGRIQIGTSNTLCRFLLLPYLKPFIRQYPHIKILISSQSSNQTLAALDQGNIDVGLVARPASIKSLDFFSLGNISDIFVASPDYMKHLNAVHTDDVRLFQEATLMLLDKHNMTRQYIDDYLTANRIEITDNLIEVTSMDLLIEFAKIGLGVACVIKEFVQEELENGTLIEIPLDIPIHQREVGFAYLKKSRREKAVEQFIHFYKECQQNHG